MAISQRTMRRRIIPTGGGIVIPVFLYCLLGGHRSLAIDLTILGIVGMVSALLLHDLAIRSESDTCD